MDLQSKSVVDLRRDIKKLMFNSDNIPAVVVEDQQRFTMIMAAFHNYERVVSFNDYYLIRAYHILFRVH